MTTALDNIAAAALALNGLTVQEAAEKARIDAAVAAALGAIAAPTKTIYLDAVAGLDTNDGTTPAKAVQSLGGANALVNAGQYAIVILLSDVVLSAILNLAGALFVISDGTQPDGSVKGTKRTVTIAPSAVQPSPLSSYAINHFAGGALTFHAVNLAIGAITTATAVIGTQLDLRFNFCGITFDPGMTSPLLLPTVGAGVFFYASSLPANYAGRLFYGVAAGGNPNSPTVRTNIVSA